MLERLHLGRIGTLAIAFIQTGADRAAKNAPADARGTRRVGGFRLGGQAEFTGARGQHHARERAEETLTLVRDAMKIDYPEL